MTRVLVVADGRGFGGAQVYAGHLVRHAPPDWHVDVATTPEHADRLAPAVQRRGGRVHVLPTAVRRPAAHELAVLVARVSPDLVQVNLVDPGSMLAALEAAQSCATTVATLHMHGAVPDRGRAQAAFDGLAHLVAVSQQSAALARQLMPASRVSHVSNGVEAVDAGPPPGAAVPVLGALGRLTSQKGFDVLLDAVAVLVARGCRVDVRIGGDGREDRVLRARARGLPVRFLGPQQGSTALLQQCDVFCLPSRAEGLPLVLLEAVSAGRAAVATDVGDVRLAIGDVVVVVPPEHPVALADGLQQLLEDPDERVERAEGGRALAAERFSARRMAERTWAVFARDAAPLPARAPR
jgi:glycosyltransferase involved in cell wall biosynthesis